MARRTTALVRTTTWAAAALTATLVASPAAAAVDDGLWYVTRTGVQEAHDAGVTGEGVTVAVIDSTINAAIPELAETDLVLEETLGCDYDGIFETLPGPTDTIEYSAHGTTMAALVVGNGQGVNGAPGMRGVAPDARLLYYAVGTDDMVTHSGCTWEGRRGVPAAIMRAVDDGAQVVAVALAHGLDDDFSDALVHAARNDAVVVMSSPQGDRWEAAEAQSGNGVLAVESHGPAGERPAEAHANPRLGVVAPGEEIRVVSGETWDTYLLSSGSSWATAWTAGALALAWSQHPTATGDQMLQALLRTTEQNTTGELDRVSDQDGYGVVSLPKLLDADPTALPDINPLVREGDGVEFLRPAYDELVDTTAEPEPGPAEPTAAAPDEPTDEAADAAGTASAGTGLVIGGVVLALVLVAAVVLALVLRRRRQPDPSSPIPTKEQ